MGFIRMREETQVLVGTLVLALPTLIRSMQFPLSCMAPIWWVALRSFSAAYSISGPIMLTHHRTYLIAKLLLIKDASIGAHMRLSCMMTSALGLGGIWAACLMSFVKGVTEYGSATQLAVMCIVAAIGAIPIAIGRACPSDPVWIWSLSVATLYGVVTISTSGVQTAAQVWTGNSKWLLLTVLMSSVTLVIVSLVVMPVTAATLLVKVTSELLGETSSALDRCLRVVCIPPELDDKSISFHGVVLGGNGLKRHTRTHRAYTPGYGIRHCSSVPQNLHRAALTALSATAGAESAPTTVGDVAQSDRSQSLNAMSVSVGMPSQTNLTQMNQIMSHSNPVSSPGQLSRVSAPLHNAGTPAHLPFQQQRQLSRQQQKQFHVANTTNQPQPQSLYGIFQQASSPWAQPPLQSLYPALHINQGPGPLAEGLERDVRPGYPASQGRDTMQSSLTADLDGDTSTGVQHPLLPYPPSDISVGRSRDQQPGCDPMAISNCSKSPARSQRLPRHREVIDCSHNQAGNDTALGSTSNKMNIECNDLHDGSLFSQPEGTNQPLTMLKHALSRPSVPGLVQRTASGPNLGDRAVSSKLTQPLPLQVLHDELTEEEYMEVMYRITEPPKLRNISPLPLQPPRPGAHLLPPGYALQLRQKLELANKYLVPASNEPPLLYVWEGFISETLLKMWSWCTRWVSGNKQAVHAATCKRFELSQWKAILKGVSTLLDSLSALEAVARDMAGDGSPDLHAWDASHQDALQGSTADIRHSTVWSLWLYAKGSRRVDENPWGHHPHSLHTVVRNALSDAVLQARQLGKALGRWPFVVNLPGVNVDDAAGADEHIRSWDDGNGKTADGKVHRTQQQETGNAWRYGKFQYVSGMQQQHRFMNGTHTAHLPGVSQHSMPWHRRVLTEAMLRRNKDYWLGTIHAAKTAMASQSDRRPLLLLRTEQMRAQYFVAMTTHQVACELENVTRMLQDACKSNPCKQFKTPSRSQDEAVSPATSKSGHISPEAHSSKESRTAARKGYLETLSKNKAVSPFSNVDAALPRRTYVVQAFANLAGNVSNAWVSAFKHFTWLSELGNVFLSYGYWRYLRSTAVDAVIAVSAGRQGICKMLKRRYVIGGIKYWFVMTALIIGVVLILRLAPGTLITPPFFAYITGVTVMRHQVETSIYQAGARVSGTVVGSMIAFGVMSTAASANNPYLVGAVVVAIATLLSPWARTSWRLATYVTATSVWSTTLCQYMGCCGHTGTLRYAIERMVSVTVGCLVPVLVNHTVLPWYLSQWALSKASEGYCIGTALLTQQYTQLVSQLGGPAYMPSCKLSAAVTRLPSMKTPGVGRAATAPAMEEGYLQDFISTSPKVALPTVRRPRTISGNEKGLWGSLNTAGPAAIATALQKMVTSLSVKTHRIKAPRLAVLTAPKKVLTPNDVQAPLTSVVNTLARDEALWHVGLYATPLAVHAMMAACTLLLDRMAAMQVALLSAQSLSWEFSSWIRRHVMAPLHPQNTRVMEGIMKLSQLATQLLTTEPNTTQRTELATKLQQEIHHVLQLRAQTHKQHLMLRQALHVKVIKLVMTHQRALAAASVTQSSGIGSSMSFNTATSCLGSRSLLPKRSTQLISGPAAGRRQLNGRVLRRRSEGGISLAQPPNPRAVSRPTRASSITLATLATLTEDMEVPDMKGHVLYGPAVGDTSRTQDGLEANMDTSGTAGLTVVTDNVAAGLDEDQNDMVRGLSELVDAGQFSPSDSVVWLACLYALVHAMDAAIHVARVSLVAVGFSAGHNNNNHSEHVVVNIPPSACKAVGNCSAKQRV